MASLSPGGADRGGWLALPHWTKGALPPPGAPFIMASWDPGGCLLLALLLGIRLVFHKNRMWWVKRLCWSFFSLLVLQELNV